VRRWALGLVAALGAVLLAAGCGTGGPATGNPDVANGQKLFTGTAQCGACHTLAAAGTSGTIGPNLDKLVAYAQQAKQPLEAFIHESIVNPNAYIQPGYPKGVMPQNFGQILTKTQLDALVTFLSQSAQAKKG